MEDNRQISKAALIRRHLSAAIMRAVAVAAVLIFIDSYLFSAVTVPSDDMFPQIRAGDLAVYYIPGEPVRRDAVIYETSSGLKAGRIAAAPGDNVDKTDSGMLEINGIIQTEQKREGIFSETETTHGAVKYPIILKDDEYFILGDNRAGAGDSRVFGIIRKGDIRGVIFILLRRQAV